MAELSTNARRVLEARYLLHDEGGRVLEDWEGLCRRVAGALAAAEARLGGDAARVEEAFCGLLERREFLPNSPTLMNAGTPLAQLAACFVLPVEDDLASIFEAVKRMAVIHQSGGGTGFDFSRLRPAGDMVQRTHGVASGPVSFIGVFDATTAVIKQGGRRRGANMGVLRVDHPDVVDFVRAKAQPGRLTNFNLSVATPDGFWEAVEAGSRFDLLHPGDGKVVRSVEARGLLDEIAEQAWATGDPGVIFLDALNRANPTPQLGPLEATNPCGELPLLANEACNLGSIRLDAFVRDGALDGERLDACVDLAVRFLDDVIEASRYPFPEIQAAVRGNRKIGLGVMGFADMLLQLGVPYDSDEACRIAGEIMSFVHEEARAASVELAAERGVFPNFEGSVYDRPDGARVRNATTTTIAPTGTISIIAGCSSGIEPLFAISFVRNVLSGTRLFESNPLFEKVAKERGFYRRELLAEVAKHPSLAKIKGIPRDVKKLFVTAFDVAPRQHLEIQAAFQRYTDNAVSKTINLPADATVEDVREIYLAAHRLKCKGITIYRYGSKAEQVLSVGGEEEAQHDESADFISADSDYAGGCIGGVCDF